MPVRKFRSVEQMEPPPWREPLDPSNLRLACDLSELAARLRPRPFPRGLHKYRSVEEASRRRALWEIERADVAAEGEIEATLRRLGGRASLKRPFQ